MTKHVRFTSLALALVMAISCVTPAFAAETPETSEFAGQDKAVRLVVFGADGTVEKETEFTVAIPENATTEDEIALTNAAARANSGMAMTRAGDYAGEDLISHRSMFTIASAGAAQVVGGGVLQHNYRILYAELHGVTGSASKFNIRIESQHNSNIYTTGDIRGEFSYLFMFDGDYYGTGNLDLSRYENIKVWCSVNSGSIHVNDVYISCSE